MRTASILLAMATWLAEGTCGEPTVASRAAGPTGFAAAYRGAVMLPAEAEVADGRRIALEGFSGLAWTGGDRFVAVMDNSRSLVSFRLLLDDEGVPSEPSGWTELELAERHDYEDLAWMPAGDSGPGRVLVCEEDGPGVHAFDPVTGGRLASLEIPAVFRARRPNRGFESLALDVDGRHVWTANEEPLVADGPDASGGGPTVVRLLRLPLGGREGGGEPLQVAYEVDPPHEFVRLLEGSTLSGLTALVSVAEGRLIALERSGCPGLPPFETRLYEVDLSGAADVSNVAEGLSRHRTGRVAKRLLWKGRIGLNLEGLCLGPRLPAGGRSLLAISDNGGLGVPGQIAGFRLTEDAAATSP